MWDEPYLETCCRSALHRLMLAGVTGRPETATDQPCLRRLQGLGLAVRRGDGRFDASPAGRARHAQEIMHGAASSDAEFTNRTRP